LIIDRVTEKERERKIQKCRHVCSIQGRERITKKGKEEKGESIWYGLCVIATAVRALLGVGFFVWEIVESLAAE
jgi:hypothetical protein